MFSLEKRVLIGRRAFKINKLSQELMAGLHLTFQCPSVIM